MIVATPDLLIVAVHQTPHKLNYQPLRLTGVTAHPFVEEVFSNQIQRDLPLAARSYQSIFAARSCRAA